MKKKGGNKGGFVSGPRLLRVEGKVEVYQGPGVPPRNNHDLDMLVAGMQRNRQNRAMPPARHIDLD